MTLIIGMVGQAVAHQVGDRLVSAARGTRTAPHDPLANKQVVVVTADALVAIGYTGLAYLEGRPTDDVIAEAVAGHPVGGGITFPAPMLSPIYEIANRVTERLAHAVPNSGGYGVDVMMVGLKRGKRDRTEPLLWRIRKEPGARAEIRRHEETPFDWRTRFSLDAIGDIDRPGIEPAVQAINAIEETGINRRDAVTRILVGAVRRASETRKTIGADCMVVRLWREGGKAIAEVEYQPVARERVTIKAQGGPVSFPAAYSPWFLAPGWVSSPSVVKGGGWNLGNIEFRIRVPDTRGEEGPLAYFGGQDRTPPPR